MKTLRQTYSSLLKVIILVRLVRLRIVQLVTGCHNIEGRSRTCSEYKDDFLLALNAFGCLLLALNLLLVANFGSTCTFVAFAHRQCASLSKTTQRSIDCVRLLVEDDFSLVWIRSRFRPARQESRWLLSGQTIG